MTVHCTNQECEKEELVWKKGVPSEHKICPKCSQQYRITRCAKCGKEFDIQEKYQTIKYLEGNMYHEGCKINLLAGNEYDIKYAMRIASNIIGDGVKEEWTKQIVQKVSRKDTKEVVYKFTL